MGTRDNITCANARESSTVHSPLFSHWTIDTTTSANCAVVVSKTSAIGGECQIGCLLMEPCRCKQRWRQLVKVSWTIKEFQETMNSVSIQRFGDRYSFCCILTHLAAKWENLTQDLGVYIIRKKLSPRTFLARYQRNFRFTKFVRLQTLSDSRAITPYVSPFNKEIFIKFSFRL